MVGDKDDQRIGIRILAIVLDGGQLFFVRTAAEKILHSAHKEDLEWGHQRRRAGPVENFSQIILPQIEFVQAEVAQIGGNQVLQNSVAEALTEKSLVAHEHVGGAQLSRFKLADKALCLCECPHQRRSVGEAVLVLSILFYIAGVL